MSQETRLVAARRSDERTEPEGDGRGLTVPDCQELCGHDVDLVAELRIVVAARLAHGELEQSELRGALGGGWGSGQPRARRVDRQRAERVPDEMESGGA